MTFEEASEQVKTKNHLLKHVHLDAIELVLIDLYVAYQDDLEEAVEKRAYLKENIQAIIESLISPKSVDGKNWIVENIAGRHIHEDIMIALNYILKPGTPKPSYIPAIFSKRLASKGLELTVDDFYCYR